MRIALFTDTYLPDINGVVSSIELLRKKLDEAGHDVYVVCTYPGVLKVKHEGKIIRLPGIELKQLYGYAVTSPIHYLLIEDLKELKFDIIHVHTEFGVGIFAGIVARKLHIPLVRTYHTTYEDYTHYVNVFDSKKVDEIAKKAVSYISKVYGDSCMRLISPSKKTKDMLLTYRIKTPIEIIPTGIEIKRFNRQNTSQDRILEIRKECNIKDDEKMLLYVGRIAQEKSIEMLIDTFKLVKEEGLKIKLVIVGGGPQFDELVALKDQLKLQDYVLFLNKKPFDEVPAYYHAADAFASASTTETQGMTYIEALSSGTVVFARRDEVLEELIDEGENGYYFDDENELLSKLKTFFSLDESTVSKMKENAMEKAVIYDADDFRDKVYKLYEEAILDYESSYKIEQIRLKNDYIVCHLIAGNNEKEEILISLDTYFNLGLRKDDKIAYDLYDSLKKEEQSVLAYRSCLKRLANKDYTVKQIYDFLAKKYDLSIEHTNAIVDKLIERQLLDDRKYALNKFDSFNANLVSQKKIVNQLRKDGVSVEIIEEVVIKDADYEFMKAKRFAEKYQSKIHNKSVNLKRQMILKKLVQEGYQYDMALEVLNLLDFNNEEFEERDLLHKEAYKAKARLEKKYSGYQLRNRLYHALVSKGFNIDAVYAMLNEMEWEDE